MDLSEVQSVYISGGTVKRTLFFLIFISCTALYAVSWNPSLDILAIYEGTKFSESIDSSSQLRSSAGGTLRLELLTITFGDHRIALPLSATLLSQSNAVGRTRIQPRLSSKLSAEYGYTFTPLFSLSASVDAIYEYYLYSDAGRWLLGATLTPEVGTGTAFSVIAPFSISSGKGSFSFSLGIGARVRI